MDLFFHYIIIKENSFLSIFLCMGKYLLHSTRMISSCFFFLFLEFANQIQLDPTWAASGKLIDSDLDFPPTLLSPIKWIKFCKFQNSTTSANRKKEQKKTRDVCLDEPQDNYIQLQLKQW